MAYSSTITKFAQSVHLVIKNRYLDDIEDDDGQIFIDQVLDWTNQYLEELENITDATGMPVYWNFLRTPNFDLGNPVLDATTLSLNAAVANLVAAPDRPVEIINAEGKTVSLWAVVQPNQLTRKVHGPRQVTKVGSQLIFSRPFNDQEAGATVYGDIVGTVPRLSDSDESALTLVKPKQLLIYGVAKNASLPDIVQGGLSPSYVQKYNDLLQQAIRFNNATSESDMAVKDDNGYIGGFFG